MKTSENKVVRLSKTKLWDKISSEVSELLTNSKVSKKFSEELLTLLETNLAPKSGGGSSAYPAILNEDGTIKEAYCRYHQLYYPADKMVISNGKSKGYCKAAIAKWNKARRVIKSLEAEAVEAMAEGNFDEAQAKSKEVVGLKASCLKSEYYDIEQDWVDFNN